MGNVPSTHCSSRNYIAWLQGLSLRYRLYKGRNGKDEIVASSTLLKHPVDMRLKFESGWQLLFRDSNGAL